MGKNGAQISSGNESDPVYGITDEWNAAGKNAQNKWPGQAADKFLLIFDQLMEKDPAPITEDVLVKTRHLNHLKLQAEKFVRNEIYESLASQIPNDP